MAPRDEDGPDRRPRVNQPAIADGQGPADWSDDDIDLLFENEWMMVNPEEIPEWVKVDNIEDFKRLCEIHCANNEDMIRAMSEQRRKWKNRAAAIRSMELRELRRQQQ